MSDEVKKAKTSRIKRDFWEELTATLGLTAGSKGKAELYLGAVAWTMIGIALTLFATIFFGLLSMCFLFKCQPGWLYLLGSFFGALVVVAVLLAIVLRLRKPILMCTRRLVDESKVELRFPQKNIDPRTGLDIPTVDWERKFLIAQITSYSATCIALLSLSLLSSSWVYYIAISFGVAFGLWAIVVPILIFRCPDRISKWTKARVASITTGHLPIIIGLVLLAAKLTHQAAPPMLIIIPIYVALAIWMFTMAGMVHGLRKRQG